MVQALAARHGELSLRFALRNQRTALIESCFRTPLQVMRPVIDEQGCMVIYLLSPTGGVVQGDRYTIHITAEANTHALFTTQAATKVYRMPQECASQEVYIEVHPGAVFEYLPDAAILFREANFHQSIHVTLHPGAVFLMQELVMPGRLARGEFMQFTTYKNLLSVRDDQGLLLYEPTAIYPQRQDYRQLGLLQTYHCWGSWYAFGIDGTAFCQQHAALLDELPDVLGSLSSLHRKGVCARLLSAYPSPLAAACERLRQVLRNDYLNIPYTSLRK